MTNYLQANTLKNFLEELSYWDGWMDGEQSLTHIGYIEAQISKSAFKTFYINQ